MELKSEISIGFARGMPDQKTACGMRQYVCWSEECHAHYIALSVFHDVFGDKYTKPLYIEKNSSTLNLADSCHERRLLGRDFFSLIKAPGGIYRLNADIYKDAQRVLGLLIETRRGLGFGLAKARLSEVQKAYSPAEAYLEARARNATVRAAASFVLQQTGISENNLGLIGSLAIDPTVEARDLDLVFTGNLSTLDLAYTWIHQGHAPETPLRHEAPPPLPTVCAFFTAQPLAYPDLSKFRVLDSKTKDFDLLINKPLSPAYLNIQVYLATLSGKQEEAILIVRDTLSRDSLKPGMAVHLRGYPSVVRGELAILVTDVEQQIRNVSFHGGGTKCS
jgi:hypothetical protein